MLPRRASSSARAPRQENLSGDLDEVAESFAAAHRGFREIAEDLAIGDAFE
jgi:hypothetical protein